MKNIEITLLKYYIILYISYFNKKNSINDHTFLETI